MTDKPKPTDDNTTLEQLKEAVLDFANRRDWGKYHRPKHLSMSIAIEAAEIMEHFQWLSEEQSDEVIQKPEVKAEVAEELADVLMYCMELANVAGIDLADAYFQKLAKNEQRFPETEDWKAKWEE
ncbi:nucleotide pyrophosphohydrolase [Planctomycetota bacterium]|nr:nucleotide pyrophosphohydrolase [Planctomycetota bacterium]